MDCENRDCDRLINKGKQHHSNEVNEISKNFDRLRTRGGSGVDFQWDKFPRYRWKVGPWLKCSKECGGGMQKRMVACFDTLHSKKATWARLCKKNIPNKPKNYRPCNQQTCPEGKWIVGPWSSCSVTCDKVGYLTNLLIHKADPQSRPQWLLFSCVLSVDVRPTFQNLGIIKQDLKFDLICYFYCDFMISNHLKFSSENSDWQDFGSCLRDHWLYTCFQFSCSFVAHGLWLPARLQIWLLFYHKFGQKQLPSFREKQQMSRKSKVVHKIPAT